MNAIIKLAWKNIWRKKWRSILMIGLVGIGVFAGTFVVAFINGWMETALKSICRCRLLICKFMPRDMTTLTI